MAPKNYSSDDSENYILGIERSFENMCTTLEEYNIIKPEILTVFQFYSKIRYFKDKKARTSNR